MANVKISELPLTLSVSPTALIPVVQNGTTCSTYACLIGGGAVAGTSGTSGAAGAAGAAGTSGTSGETGAAGTSGTSGGFGAAIIAGSGTLSSVRDGVSNVAAGNYSFAGGGLSNSVTPGVTTSSKTFPVTANSTNSFGVTGNVTNFFPDTVVTPPAIGSSLQGGKVAYILQPGDAGYNPLYISGLIAANTDQSTGIQWYNGSNVNVTTSTDLGTGLANTDAIIAAQGAVATDYAAGLARAVTDGGYNDWYLPSIDELNKLYLNNGSLGLSTTIYWASSQGGDDASAYYLDFSYGGIGGNPKYATSYVRAVRSFSINAELGTTTVGAEFRGTAGTSGVTLNNWSSCYTYPTTILQGTDNIGVGPYDNVVFTFTDNGAEKSSVVGGNSNVVNGSFSFIGGGGGTTYQYANTICNTADYSFIGAGQGNTIQSSGRISSFDQSSFVYTGTTAGTNKYYNLYQCISSGSGTGAYINVDFVDNIPSIVEINMGQYGANYKPNDTITIPGSAINGGTDGVDDVTFSVYEVASANNSAILGGCNNTLAVGAPSFIAGSGINISQANCNYATCGGVPVPALYINNLVFATPGANGSIATSNPGVCGQLYICGPFLAVSGY